MIWTPCRIRSCATWRAASSWSPTTPPPTHKGSPADPFTWEEANEKFRRYTASVLGTKRAAEIADAVAGLEHAADVRALTRLLAAG